jgi:hypothetical protein
MKITKYKRGRKHMNKEGRNKEIKEGRKGRRPNVPFLLQIRSADERSKAELWGLVLGPCTRAATPR